MNCRTIALLVALTASVPVPTIADSWPITAGDTVKGTLAAWSRTARWTSHAAFGDLDYPIAVSATLDAADLCDAATLLAGGAFRASPPLDRPVCDRKHRVLLLTNRDGVQDGIPVVATSPQGERVLFRPSTRSIEVSQ